MFKYWFMWQLMAADQLGNHWHDGYTVQIEGGGAVSLDTFFIVSSIKHKITKALWSF